MIEVSVSNGAEMPNIGIFSVESIAYWIHLEQQKKTVSIEIVKYGNVFRKYPIWFLMTPDLGTMNYVLFRCQCYMSNNLANSRVRNRISLIYCGLAKSIALVCRKYIFVSDSFYFNHRWNLLVLFNFWCFLLCIFCVFCLQFCLSLALVWW